MLGRGTFPMGASSRGTLLLGDGMARSGRSARLGIERERRRRTMSKKGTVLC